MSARTWPPCSSYLKVLWMRSLQGWVGISTILGENQHSSPLLNGETQGFVGISTNSERTNTVVHSKYCGEISTGMGRYIHRTMIEITRMVVLSKYCGERSTGMGRYIHSTLIERTRMVVLSKYCGERSTGVSRYIHITLMKGTRMLVLSKYCGRSLQGWVGISTVP